MVKYVLIDKASGKFLDEGYQLTGNIGRAKFMTRRTAMIVKMQDEAVKRVVFSEPLAVTSPY